MRPTIASSLRGRRVFSQTQRTWGFPSGPVIKIPPCSARDTSSIPGLGRSHVPQLAEPEHLESVLYNEGSLHTIRKSSPSLPQLEKAVKKTTTTVKK